MKNILSYLLIIVMLCSCRAFYNIFPTPNDDPGWMHHVAGFKKSMDSLQMEVDKFVESDTTIQRVYNNQGYDKGIYRKYIALCNNDTLKFNINFSGDDSSSTIAVRYFYMKGVDFTTLDYNTERKAIKRNKSLYDTCQACYKRIFLAPLKKRLQK